MKYDFDMDFECPICHKTIKYDESMRGNYYLKDNLVAELTYDCHGIPFRTLCCACADKAYSDKGYDGEYYTELDECIDDYY